MWLQKGFFLLIAQFSLYYSGNAFFDFPSFDWINGKKTNEEHNGFNFQHKPQHAMGQEVEDFHFGSSDHHQGQEIEEISFNQPDHHKGQELEDFHFGTNDHHQGQEVEEINFGHKSDHPKGQEVEEINFGHRPDHPKGQEIEEINFGHKPDHPKGQKVEEINFGHKPDHPKGQELEDFHFGTNDHHQGQEVEEINFGHNPDHPRGQEVEEINFGHKPDHPNGQEIEEINFGHKPDHPKGQEIEEINFGHKPDHPKGQEVEEINFGHRPDHPKGQEVEEINFGHKPDHPKGQEIEEINFGHKPDHPKGQKVEEINFLHKPDHPKGQELEDFHFGTNDHHQGQEVEEINFGHKPDHPKGQEIEEINFGHKPDHPKGQEVEEISFGFTKGHNERHEQKDFHTEHKDNNFKGQEIVENTENDGDWFDIFLPETKVEDCKEKLSAVPNSLIQCESNRKCLLHCDEGYRFSTGADKLIFECDHGKWISIDNVTAECRPVCEPPCQNNGICIGKNQCSCPEHFEGAYCQITSKPCSNHPPVAQNSYANCNASYCSLKCFDNYAFPDGSSATTLICHQGQWKWTREDWNFIPDCKPSCEPPCLNGGSCLDFNKCQCPRNYAGPQCQFDIAVCDAAKLNFNGFYTCRGENDKVLCSISCPDGQEPDLPIAKEYICNYSDGKFFPEPVPKCLYDKNAEVFKFQSSSYTLQKGTEGSKFNHIPYNIFPTTAECSSWKRSHYKTFDGEVFSFDGNCSYILLQDVENTFRIISANEKCESSCLRSLKLFYEDNNYEIHYEEKTPILIVNTEVFQVPTQINGFLLEKIGDKISISLQTIDVTLDWDVEDHITIKINENLWNKTGGLCGSFNGNSMDDFTTADSFLAPNLEVFVQSWVNDPYECESTPILQNTCKKNNVNGYCQEIFNDPRFEKCTKERKFTLYQEACGWDICKCGKDCACDTIREFVKSCKKYLISEGLPDSTADWREIANCPLNCDIGKVYSTCGPSFQQTCGSFAMDNSIAKYSECVEGCFCPEGLVHFNNSCIQKEHCPCYWRSLYYGKDEVITKDCNTCICRNGEWTCTSLKCNSRCSIVGNSHYITFDGRRYDLTSQCSYYLVKSTNYSIISENLLCEGDFLNEIFDSYLSKYTSCTKIITIQYKTLEIKLKMGIEAIVNGLEVTSFPLEVDGVIIRITSHYLIVTLPDGIELWWDSNANVYIDVPGNYKQPTRGLCGTYNNNQKDDFITPEGDIEETISSFAQKWKTDETCTETTEVLKSHPCDDNIKQKEIAEKHCQKLTSHIFKDCHPLVDVNPFYKNCLYDVCTCQKDIKLCICPIFADYANQCARQSVELPWRNEVRECGLHCQNGEIYRPCGDSCSRSCQDISIMKGHCEKKCVEGCTCPDGLALNLEGQCIPISKCPCFHQNIKYEANHQFIIENDKGPQLCICQNALWSCRNATPLEIARDYEYGDNKCDESAHEEYTNCQPAEPKTCKNMHEKPKHSTRICFPGCVCKKGFVWDSIGKLCVNASECPCHHGGRSYADGEKIQQDCNTCSCKNGVWSCTERDCSSICSTWGDTHFKTFDGKIYDFQGSCEFVLAAGTASEHDNFIISLQIVPCGSTGISCPKSVILKVQSPQKEEKVVFKKSKQFKIPMGLERISVREVGLFVFAEVFDLGITVQWDKGTRVYVRADARWKNKVRGLCGNFNDNELDDFKTPSSGETNEISPVLFADSWRLETYCPESNSIIDTCARLPHRKSWAVEKCSTLNSEIFEPCHSEVSLEPYLERCIVDTCGCDEGGDCDCMCTAIAAYAEECSLRGIPIKWRSQNFCPLQCDENSKYSSCISKCPPKSCDNQYQHSAVLRTCSEESCVEGCDRIHCPPGQVLADSSSSHCIPIASCKTVCQTVNNVTYLEGDLMESDHCHSCYCSHHKKVCSGKPCSEVTTTSTATPTSGCPEGEIWDDCIVKCDHTCNYLAASINSNSDLQCLTANNCVSGCRGINLSCPDNMFLRDKHTCLQKKDCPCISFSHSLVKPGDVVQESECEKCQCVDNEYECIHICTTPSSAQTFEPIYNYTKKQYTDSPGWDFAQNGNVTLMYRPTTIASLSCPSRSYKSLLDPLTHFSASSHFDDSSLPSFSEISSKGAWVAGVSNADQYLQVDLLRVEPIYAVNVAGYSGNYVTSYYLLHSLDGNRFKDLFDNNGRKEIFGGPLDSHQSVKQVLPVPIEARYIRFHPASWHGQISMKVDVLGCADISVYTTTPHFTTSLPSICQKPIGIGHKKFPNLQIIVTSSKPNNGPDQIGFDSEKGWQPLINSKSEWIEFDFNDIGNFTGISTKGVSQGNELLSAASGDSWVERYQVEYSHDGLTWNPILDDFGDKMTFMGNTDGETEKKNFFKRPIRAKSLKILPMKWHGNIALRLDIMGCYEPTYSEDQVTPPILIPTTKCNVCPGALINEQNCNCQEEEWWNGENCVSHSECPCFNGLISYPVGSTFTTENCDECICKLYGLSHCTPKHCPDCKQGLQKIYTPLCGCTCKSCEENTRLCPTTNICLKESAWCDGIQDCPDDELNCTTPTPKVTPTPSSCSVTCPPGYEIVYKNKTINFSEAEDMTHRKKSVKTSKSVKTYRKSKKNRKMQKMTECPPYDCVPVKEVTPTECPPPQCPHNYKIAYKKHNEVLEQACSIYACEPVFEYAECDVLLKNIKTFDGLEYKYEFCDHTLTTHDSGLWNVTAYKNCTFGAACVTVLLINHGDHSVELNPQHRLINVDSFPYTSNQVELLNSKMADFTINVIGDSVVFTSEIYGFEVVQNLNGKFKLKVPSYMKSHLTGLCGLYNGHPDDDRTLPGGKLSKTTVEFGDAWHNQGGQKCTEAVCPMGMQNTALEICLKLKEKPFNTCDENFNLELCIESACECLVANDTVNDCKCRVLSDFAATCKNLTSFGWRMEHDCPALCPPNLVYYDCYPYACQPQCGNEECADPATSCYSGCFCQDGLVKRGDECIKVSECRDCVCSGLGNSNYLTFDGGLTFNGNCTYVAVKEKSTDISSFQVLISNTLCNGSDFMTCTDKVEVKLPGHSIKVIALSGSEEMVVVLVDDFKENIYETRRLDKSWASIILNEEVSVVQIELPNEHVTVQYYFRKYAFTISLPSHLYSGKIEGLCGNCKQYDGESEEIIDPEKWKVGNDKNCLIEPPANCIPTSEQKETCLLLNSSKIFGQCFALVDPTPFLDQCLTLICENGHFCQSLEAYGQACRDSGVCVNWRTEYLCPLTCPSGLEYEACNIGCQKTCDNYKEITSTCTKPPVEGCFCPNDQILINGTCKSKNHCELCDGDGHHFEGESWQVDKCTNCSCRNRVVTCERTECTEGDIVCGDDEIILKEENDFECCPKQKCACRPHNECDKIEMPIDLLPGMEAVVNKSGCCPRVEVVCRQENCPEIKPCREHYIQKMANTTACCPDYYCEKPNNICIYEFGGSLVQENKIIEREVREEVVKEVGEKWKDGPCKTCACVEKDSFAEIVCSVMECPSLNEHHDYNDYDLNEIYDPEKCCPEVIRKSCKHEGITYKVGDSWMPDENNPCETMKCNDWGGTIKKEIRLEMCNQNCDEGWEYKSVEGACCGHCVQTGCLVDHKIYKPGQIWFSEDRCAKSTCIQQNGHYSVSTEMPSCLSVEDCPQEDIYFDGCCQKCNLRSENKNICDVKFFPLESTIKLISERKEKHGHCHNVHPIKNFSQCAGNCDSHTIFKSDTWSHESVCKCCTPQEYSLITVPMKCEDGTEFMKTITVPSKCFCSPCGG